MSTPAPVVKTSWLKEHERIVLTFLVLSFGIFGFNHWLDKSAADATTKATYAEQSAAQSKALADTALAQLAAQQASFNQAEQAREAEMASLAAAIASRDAVAQTKVAEVTAPKTPTQAVTDVQTTYALPVPVTVTSDGADVPTADLQLFTVTKINSDTCTNDLQDTRTELAATTVGLNQATALLTNADNAITDLKNEAAKTETANAAEVKQLKSEARKSKFKIFWIGVVAGFLGRSSIR